MTFGNVEFHLPIGLPLCEAIQVILQDLAINGDFIFLYKTQSSAKRRTDDLILSGRSLIKMSGRSTIFAIGFESISLDHLYTTQLLTLNFQAEVCFSGSIYVYALQAEAYCIPLKMQT